MPDYDGISVALAARFAPGLMSPPAGQLAVRSSTATLPNNLTAIPIVLVFPDSGSLKAGNGTRQGEASFKVQFVYSQGLDMPRDSVAIRKWLGVLLDQLRGAAQLGGLVAEARADAWRTVKVTYGGEEFNGIELDVTVVTSEGWTPTA